jgi:hypothetical protein
MKLRGLQEVEVAVEIDIPPEHGTRVSSLGRPGASMSADGPNASGQENMNGMAGSWILSHLPAFTRRPFKTSQASSRTLSYDDWESAEHWLAGQWIDGGVD